MSEAYYRCSHCRGFYESELEKCKYCGYASPFSAAGGKPRGFADRATCRAIQCAEWEQLPEGVRSDPMGPPEDEHAELCGCLHCGQDAPPFEAVEMRWMVNEDMWACPCTTCGGRGFNFDIHPLAARWTCNGCNHKWAPPGGNAKPSNCKCPKCGSTEASGWFQDEYTEAEIENFTDEQYLKYFGETRADAEKNWKEFNEKFERERQEKIARGEDPNKLPWHDEAVSNADESGDDDICAYDPETSLGEEKEEERGYPVERMPDDIDFPRKSIRENRADIPW